MGAVIKLRNLRKYYKDVKAVDGISFETPERSIHAILGPNGAGKTTTLKCILGIIRPTDGDVEIFGVKNDPQRVLNRVSFVPEEKDLYTFFNLMDMIEYTKKMTENFDPVKALELADEFQLPRKDKIITFSHGMKTQLYLALAFAQNVELMVLDEPTWGLDPILRNKVLKMMRDLSMDRTILYSSHILSEVEKVSDKVTIMVKGKVVFDGYLEEAKSNFKCVIVPAEVNIPEELAVSISMSGKFKMVVVKNEDALDEIERLAGGRMRIEDMNLEDIFTTVVGGKIDVEV